MVFDGCWDMYLKLCNLDTEMVTIKMLFAQPRRQAVHLDPSNVLKL